MFSPLRARSLSVQAPAVQASTSVQAPVSAQVARFVQDVRSSQAPQPVQESPDSNLNHVFPQLAFTPPLEADPCAFVPVSPQEPSPGDPFARREEGQVFEPKGGSPEIPAQPGQTSSALVLVSPQEPSPSDPSTGLEPGQIFEQRVAGEPDLLGSLDVETMTASNVLFTFGVFCVMARLRPNFTYKYGADGKDIGVRLSLYGHTVVVEPVPMDAHAVRVIACRRGLAKLRKFNPHWVLPPSPMDGPSGPEWDWVQLLQDFSGEQGWRAPDFLERPLGSQCLCNVIVNRQIFRCARQCITPGEARNSVAHIAMHQLLIAEEVLGPRSIPAADLLKPIPVYTRSRQLDMGKTVPPSPIQGFTAAFTAAFEDVLRDRIQRSGPKHQLPKAKASKHDAPLAPLQPQKVNKKKAKKKNKPPVEQAKPPAVQGKKKAQPSIMQDCAKTGSNNVPLTRNRIPPVEQQEVTEDKLASLKAVQLGLRTLHATASYWRLLNKICEVLKIKVPDIRQYQNRNDNPQFSHLIRASFDDSSPYLSRASPVHLADIQTMSDNAAHALGVKKVIIYLLNILREDAGIAISDHAYLAQLPFLYALEREIEDRLPRGLRPVE